MKSNFLLAIFAGVALLAWVTTATAADTKSGCATVVRVEGQVEYNLGDGKWIPLVAGKALPPGSTVRTLFNGHADIVLGREIQFPQAKPRPDRIGEPSDSRVTGFADYRPSAEQNAIRMAPDTTVSVDKLFITDTGADSVSDTELNLTQGKIFCSVKKLTGASQYTVKIPKGIAGVRGTRFSIDVNGTVYCFESSNGGVVLSFKDGNGNVITQFIKPGILYDAITNVLSFITKPDMADLERVFSSLRTLYVIILNFDYDRTRTHISDINGHWGSPPTTPPQIMPPTPQSLPGSSQNPPAL